MPDFLLEIGCEEIPARMIDAASAELCKRVSDVISRERLGGGKIDCFATTRRLAVIAAGVAAEQPYTIEHLNGPAVSVAYKDGQPTPAAYAFAKKAGVDISGLAEKSTPKGKYVYAEVSRSGRKAIEIFAQYLPKELNSIYWPKNMYWRRPSEKFVRPVRWLVALLDAEVIPLEFDGIRAGNQSRGHRILAEGPIQIPSGGSGYVETLRAARVLGRSEREQQIRKGLDVATRTIPGARWREDKALLDAVVNLTEFPSAILGSFDQEFLKLPEEVLVTVMRDHQKYFAIEDANGKLLPHFLAVLNTDGDPLNIIRHGHERVLRARFNDARFFWQTDQKHPLRERTAWLKNVTFQKDLGSYYDKTRRVQELCRRVSARLKSDGAPGMEKLRSGVIHKAAWLAKTDLTTELVKEFTELQGIVGGLYARAQVLDPDMKDEAREAIAAAIYDQYKPESMEDSVPRSVEGAILAIADKADTIAGMFALGLQPTGSKDPFALRRQANAIVKTIAEKKLPVSLSRLFADAREIYRGSAAEGKLSGKVNYASAVQTFLRERLEFHLRDALGFKYDVVNAVLAAGSDDVVDAVARAEAVTSVRPSADFESISVAFKRIKNILRQASESKRRAASVIDVEALLDGAEKELATQIPQTAEVVDALREKRDYERALLEISKLRPAVDRFFDNVMVMVEDDGIRANRLALLKTLFENFSTIADFSEIATESKESSKQ